MRYEEEYSVRLRKLTGSALDNGVSVYIYVAFIMSTVVDGILVSTESGL